LADRQFTRWAAAVLTALLAACASQVAAPPETPGRGPAEFPEDDYRSLAARGAPVFQVDRTRSLAVIEVRRGGSLALLGHDHVIASHDVAGYVAPDEGRADLFVPLDALVVDEPGLRAEAGFDTQPSPADIAGTRRNMLEKVLESDRYPYALIAVRGTVAGAGAPQLRVKVTLHGATRVVDAPVQMQRLAEELDVTGTLAIDQSQFGITPFSVLGGAIAVQGRVNIRFRLRAAPMK
jgi:hypothetical protein